MSQEGRGLDFYIEISKSGRGLYFYIKKSQSGRRLDFYIKIGQRGRRLDFLYNNKSIKLGSRGNKYFESLIIK